jgi:colicin V production protein
MNIFSVIVILLIISSGVMGLKKGFLKESVVFIGTILVYIISFLLKDKIGLVLCKWFPFFSFDGLQTLNILVYQLIAFIFIATILFSIATIIFKLTGIIQKLVDITIILTLPSKILGFIFGILEGYIVMFLILIILAIPLRNVELFKESTVVTKIMYNSPILSKTLGGVPKTIEDILDVTTEIQKTDYNKNKVALDIMKIELDHNIISKEDTLDLIERGKLDKVQGIKSFVKNYNKNS